MSTVNVTPKATDTKVDQDNSKKDNGNVSSVAPKLIQTTVTVVEGTETAAILFTNTEKVIALAFSLQDSYENASIFQKDALHDASVMFLKAQCQRCIATWDNAVTKASKMQKYQSMTRKQVEDALSIHPKVQVLYKTMLKAVAIKKDLK